MAVKKAMTRAEQIAGNEQRLQKLAAKLRRAATKLDLAAYYAGDGATLTADAIARTGRGKSRGVSSSLLEVVRNLNGRKWDQ